MEHNDSGGRGAERAPRPSDYSPPWRDRQGCSARRRAAEDALLLRLFLDNRPSRSPNDPADVRDVAMGALEGPGQRDPVLRSSEARFERSMVSAFRRALAVTPVPTFPADWRAAAQDEAGAVGVEEG